MTANADRLLVRTVTADARVIDAEFYASEVDVVEDLFAAFDRLLDLLGQDAEATGEHLQRVRDIHDEIVALKGGDGE